ncbi:MAG: DUF2807 domain-containing protein [Robiginitalea sp.]
MKKHLGLLVLILNILGAGCGKNGPDCFQVTGEVVGEVLPLPSFSRITVFENVKIVLKHGDTQEVFLETGENLRSDITAEVVEGTLELRDGNSCNYLRPYGNTTFYITTPDLEEVRSSTGWPIRSDGILPFTDLKLISESFNNEETGTTDGSFELVLDVDRLSVVVNGIAYFNLKGSADRFSVVIAAGDSRIDARDLAAGSVVVRHRGSNDILVNPVNAISGLINGYGDVLSYNRPAEIDVEETFRGRLIFME